MVFLFARIERVCRLIKPLAQSQSAVIKCLAEPVECFFLVTHLAYGLWVMVPELLNWAQRLDLYCCVFTDDDHDHRCVSGHLRNC